MLARIAADAVLTLHLAFVVFVVFGGLLVLRRPWLAWLHVPAAIWGGLIELAGWLCPLTTIEVTLRRAAGESGYAGGFIENYVVPVLYPPGLTRTMQMWLGAAILLLNAAVYALLVLRHRRRAGD